MICLPHWGLPFLSHHYMRHLLLTLSVSQAWGSQKCIHWWNWCAIWDCLYSAAPESQFSSDLCQTRMMQENQNFCVGRRITFRWGVPSCTKCHSLTASTRGLGGGSIIVSAAPHQSILAKHMERVAPARCKSWTTVAVLQCVPVTPPHRSVRHLVAWKGSPSWAICMKSIFRECCTTSRSCPLSLGPRFCVCTMNVLACMHFLPSLIMYLVLSQNLKVGLRLALKFKWNTGICLSIRKVQMFPHPF